MKHTSPGNNRFLSLITILFLIALQACNLPSAKKASASPQITALNNLENASASKPALTIQNGFPLSARIDVAVQGANPVERARNFITTYKDLYGQANPDLGLELLRANGPNNEHVVFYQTYKDIPVFGAELVVQLNGDHVIFTSGNLLHGDVKIDTNPVLTALEAESAVRSKLNAADASAQGVTKLMIYDRSLAGDVIPAPRLVWRVMLGSGPTESFVDALDGQVLYSYVLSESGYELDLEHANDTNADVSSCYYFTTKDDAIGDEDGLNKDNWWDPDAVDIWWYAQDAYNFYNAWGRDSYDNNGEELELYVHAHVDNARWNEGCQIFEFAQGWVGQDVMVHEFTHAVINHTSGLIYADQSGALNESFADIMAAGQDGNWTQGEARTGFPGEIVRDLSVPSDMSQYDDMMQCGGYACEALDHGGVHKNSAIHNYVAYLLANGGTQNGFTVQSIGAQKVTGLMLNVLYNVPAEAQFVHARDWAVAWALQWSSKGEGGWTAFDVCQIRNAYAAVNIAPTGGDFDCDGVEDNAEADADGDFVYNDNCPQLASFDIRDTDNDGKGDVCDPDQDNDGQPNEGDNCPLVYNPDLADGDGDGIGDACQDTDGDKKIDKEDNCPADANYNQKDVDADGQGDVCDPDDDNDGQPDLTDNAVYVYNPDQADADADQVGDVIDNCVNDPNTDQANADHDIQGDACDPDADNDGHANSDDNCPFVFNPDQFDLNKNGIGTSCDDEDQQALNDKFKSVTIPILANPGYVFKLKIPQCAGGCPDDWGYESFQFGVLVEDLPIYARALVIDDQGNVAGKSHQGGAFQQIDFRPQGGHEYFLAVAFGPETQSGEQVTFTVAFAEGDAPGGPQPTPSGPTSTPLPHPPEIGQLPSVTASSTPTPAAAAATSGPTFTLRKNAFCRKGPDVSFEDIDAILTGETVDILNVSPDGFWYYVFWKKYNVKCWVSAGSGQANGNIQGIQVLIGPSTFTPTPAPLILPSPTYTGKP